MELDKKSEFFCKKFFVNDNYLKQKAFLFLHIKRDGADVAGVTLCEVTCCKHPCRPDEAGCCVYSLPTASMNALMSSALQTVVRGPSLTGLG